MKPFGDEIVRAFFTFQHELKLYHWQTKSYSRHKATDKLYEKLFGGFEDLSATAEEDENEIDELANVPKEKKTKQGYLKDGFVVDSSDAEEATGSDNESDEPSYTSGDAEEEEQLILEDLGSELSEESYI